MADAPAVPATEKPGVVSNETVPATEKPGVPKEYLEKITALERQVNFLIAKETKAAKVEHKQEPAADDTLEKQFAAFRKERDDERAALAAERRENAIQAAVNALPDLDDEARELLIGHIERKHGTQIAVEGKQVLFTDTDQSKKTVKDLVSSVMSTVGQRFVKAPTVPTSKGMSGTNGKTATGSTGQHPGFKMSYKDLMDAKNPSVRASFQAEHPEEFAQKKAEYFASR